jgi:hypothetical protein
MRRKSLKKAVPGDRRNQLAGWALIKRGWKNMMRLMREQMPEAVLCGNMLKSQCLNKGYLNLPAVSGAI